MSDSATESGKTVDKVSASFPEAAPLARIEQRQLAFVESLTRLADRRAANLSAGQKRRLGLARLLVTGRPVWVLDEPTVSLDAASVALFAGVVRDHLATGGAALMATHIDLGLEEAAVLDLSAFRPVPGAGGAAMADDAFAGAVE